MYYMYILNVMYMHASLSLSSFPTLLFFSLILEHSVCNDMITLALDIVRTYVI